MGNSFLAPLRAVKVMKKVKTVLVQIPVNQSYVKQVNQKPFHQEVRIKHF
ncbi:MAG: hypothetical protein U9P72_02830 [Campylobacterota bacterium]|nr:hypothetical protein [Campylobacterota bacterium]